MVARPAASLRAALGFATLGAAPRDAAFAALHSWLDSWRGVGDVVVGMHRQGYDVQLTQYDERGWLSRYAAW
jgi:hypothetical protein